MSKFELGLLLVAATLGGCTDAGTGDDILTLPPRTATVYDDGDSLTVTGCGSALFCGFSEGESMSVTSNGVTLPVPACMGFSIDGVAQFTFDTSCIEGVTEPSDGAVQVTLDDLSSNIPLLPAFDLTGPTGDVSRAVAMQTVHWTVLPSTEAQVYVEGTCDQAPGATTPAQSFTDVPGPTPDTIGVPNDGAFTLDVASEMSKLNIDTRVSCDVTVLVLQLGPLIEAVPGLVTQTIQARAAAFTSTP